MKRLITLLLLVSCAPQNQDQVIGPKGDPGSPGEILPSQPCTVVQGQGSATILCPDGTSAIVHNGEKGDAGVSIVGSPGRDGSSCSVMSLSPSIVAPNGGALITCTDNTSAMVLNGAPGAVGQPGTPGTVISTVNLCPGSTNYPSTFIEVGVCINNKLYAVYSIPGAFLTEVPPGQYVSHGINNSCNLTIGPNCAVSH